MPAKPLGHSIEPCIKCGGDKIYLGGRKELSPVAIARCLCYQLTVRWCTVSGDCVNISHGLVALIVPTSSCLSRIGI